MECLPGESVGWTCLREVQKCLNKSFVCRVLTEPAFLNVSGVMTKHVRIPAMEQRPTLIAEMPHKCSVRGSPKLSAFRIIFQCFSQTVKLGLLEVAKICTGPTFIRGCPISIKEHLEHLDLLREEKA